MVLNSSRLIPALCSRYCGMALYFSNSACHSDVSSGGATPVTGFHSTIDRPDSVSRVAPPTTTVTNIRAATASSHSRTTRRRGAAKGARAVMGAFACPGGPGAYKFRGVPAIEPHDAHPRAQAHRCDPADRLGGDVGAPRDGVGAIAAGQGQRRDRGDLLRGRGARLGAAGDAAHSLDVAAIAFWPRGAKRIVRSLNWSMYPIRNDPEHDKDRSEHPCDQSQVSPDENNTLAN